MPEGKEMVSRTASSTYATGFVLIPRFNLMALIATLEPMRIANYISGRTLYDWNLLSVDGGNVTASNGMELSTMPIGGAEACWDAVFVCGSWDSEHFDSPELFAWLRRIDRMGVVLGAMDIGTYILARAGLISNQAVAMHWYCSRAFAEQYPDIQVEERLYLAEGNRATIPGGIAGLDMMLNDIKERHGAQLSQEVADHILYSRVRPPDSPQRAAAWGDRKFLLPVMRQAIALIENNIEDPLTIPQLAQAVGISQRKLERLFRKHMGSSVVGFYRVLRLQHARVLLTNTDLPIREISVACGYSSLSHFAKSFHAQFGRRPRDNRDAWPEADPAPVWLGITASLKEPAAPGQ